MSVKVECSVFFMFCVFSSIIEVVFFVNVFVGGVGFIGCWLLSGGLCIIVKVTCRGFAGGWVLVRVSIGRGCMMGGRRGIGGRGWRWLSCTGCFIV